MMISVDGLRKTYTTNDGEIRAVDDVSFDIERGSIVGLLGPNGAGKTTTIKSTLGLVVPTEGTVRIAGENVYDSSNGTYERVSAVLEGARNIYWRLTVQENLKFFSRIQNVDPRTNADRRVELLERLNLTEKAESRVKTLSRGMKQKAALACALIRDTPVTFLDEPTLGLDVETSRQLRLEIRRLAEQEDRTIVISSHDMDIVQQVCDRVIIMNEGRIVADEPVDELLDLFRTRAVEAVLREPADGVRDRLESEFDVTEWTADGDQVAFTTTLSDDEEFYDLSRTLEGLGVTLESIATVEPDLEDVFVDITESRESKTEVTHA